jgi:hypothetical protein
MNKIVLNSLAAAVNAIGNGVASFSGVVASSTSGYVLDAVGGAIAAAYGLHKLKDSYSGSAVRVRRSSDNVEADIGFRPDGTLDEGALMQHVGAENLLTQSQDFTVAAAWTVTPVITATPNAVLAPDGTNTGTLFTVNATGAGSVVRNTAGSFTVPNASPIVYSLYIKKAANIETNGSFVIRNSTTATNLSVVTVSWASMVVTLGTATIIPDQNGWYRVLIPISSGYSATDTLVVYAGASGASYTAGHSWYAWGAQVNTGTTALDYCKTTTTATTSGQNLLLFSDAQGGSGAAAPSGWAVDQSFCGITPSGFTSGTVNGVGYTDLQINGTTSNTNRLLFSCDSSVITTRSVIPGYIYSFGWNASISAGTYAGGRVQATALWYDAAQTFLSLSLGSSVTLTGTFTKYVDQFTAPTNAKYMRIRWDFLDAPIIGTVVNFNVRFGGTQLNQGTTLLPYKATTSSIIDNGSGYVTKVFDQSGILGPELCTDPTLDNPSAWTFTGASPGWSVSGGLAQVTATAGGNRWINIANALTIGKTYLIEFDLVVNSGGVIPDVITPPINTINTSGHKRLILTATGTSLAFMANTTFTGSIDNVSFRETRDLVQTTVAAQPRIVFAGTIDRISANLVKDPSFDDPSKWAPGTGWTISGGVATASATSVNINQVLPTQPVGTSYQVDFDATVTAGNVRAEIGGALGATISSSGHYSTRVTSINSSMSLFIYGTTFSGTIDNVVVRLVINGVTTPDRPAIRTDGVDDSMATGSFTIAQPFTRASVLQFLSITGTVDVLGTGSPEPTLYRPVSGLNMFAGAGRTGNRELPLMTKQQL